MHGHEDINGKVNEFLVSLLLATCLDEEGWETVSSEDGANETFACSRDGVAVTLTYGEARIRWPGGNELHVHAVKVSYLYVAVLAAMKRRERVDTLRLLQGEPNTVAELSEKLSVFDVTGGLNCETCGRLLGGLSDVHGFRYGNATFVFCTQECQDAFLASGRFDPKIWGMLTSVE